MDEFLKDTLSKSYNANAAMRDQMVLSDWKRSELDTFLTYTKAGAAFKVLDLGAGAGQQGQYLQEHGLSVTCVDLSPEMVRLCESKGLEARQMDFYSLDFPPDSFDAVWSMNALLHVPKKSLDLVLAQVQRVLKPGGLFYMGLYGGNESEGVWEEDVYEPKRFFSFYPDDAIQMKVRPYFNIVDFRVVPLQGNMDYQALILRKEKPQEAE